MREGERRHRDGMGKGPASGRPPDTGSRYPSASVTVFLMERHMLAFDGVFGDLSAQQTVVTLSMLAAFIAMAAVAWWRFRYAAACRPHTVEHRAWTFCPQCGWARPDTSDATRLPESPLPSDMLRRGWTRSPALDRHGRLVLASDERAVIAAWSLWRAGSSALEAGSPLSRSISSLRPAMISARDTGNSTCSRSASMSALSTNPALFGLVFFDRLRYALAVAVLLFSL